MTGEFNGRSDPAHSVADGDETHFSTSVRTVESGVPVFRIESVGSTRAGLVFRVGEADEPAAQRGVSHLVEHLTLGLLDEPGLSFNGFVGPSTTEFVVEGTAADAGRFLQSVSRGLAALPEERLAMERQVLLTEAAGRAPNLITELLFWRYGLRGLGGTALREFGLDWLGAAEAAAWVAHGFTRDNAAVWIAGPDPDQVSVDLDLSAGPRLPAPSLADGPYYLPGWANGPPRVVGLGLVGPRSIALGTATDLLAEHLRTRLRVEQGVSYNVTGTYLPLDADHAHVLLAADCLEANAPTVIAGLLAGVDEFCANGPDDDQLARNRARFRTAEADPQMATGHVVIESRDELWGAVTLSMAEVDAQREAVTGAEVAAAFAEPLDRAFLVVPPGATVDGQRFFAVPAFSDRVVEGTTIEPAKTVPFGCLGDRLRLDDEGISFVADGGRAITVRFEDCVLARAWPGGERQLLGVDGFVVNFAPADWADPATVEAHLRAHVPADRWLTMEGPAPFAGHDPAAGRASQKAVRAQVRKQWARNTGVMAVILVLMTCLAVAALATERYGMLGPAVIGALVAARRLD
jgi:hypothetical protein